MPINQFKTSLKESEANQQAAAKFTNTITSIQKLSRKSLYWKTRSSI
jgi:hypothetical protein